MSGLTNQQIAKSLMLCVETINQELKSDTLNSELLLEAKIAMSPLVNQVISEPGVESQIDALQTNHSTFETLFQNFFHALSNPTSSKKTITEAFEQLTGTGIPNLFSAVFNFQSALPEPIKTSPVSSASVSEDNDFFHALNNGEFDHSEFASLFAPKATDSVAAKPAASTNDGQHPG